jgi:prepilin signal peptidase PulO-like enzyme (type II secretory pathway)
MPPSSTPALHVFFPWAETAAILAGFVWGAILGSFLNVVVHRVPRGESVVHGRSRCPRCAAAIRPWDNLPVLGWFLLRGRCRDCAAPIAVRYPLVEAGCGLLVAAVAAADFVHGGIDRVLLEHDWLPVARFVFHAAAVVTLVAWSLLAAGGTAVSRRTVWIAVAAVGLWVVALPTTQPIGLLPDGGRWPADGPRVAALATWLAGIAAAAAARLVVPRSFHATLTLLGAVFGWQAVTVVAVVTATALLAQRPPWQGGRRRDPRRAGNRRGEGV